MEISHEPNSMEDRAEQFREPSKSPLMRARLGVEQFREVASKTRARLRVKETGGVLRNGSYKI